MTDVSNSFIIKLICFIREISNTINMCITYKNYKYCYIHILSYFTEYVWYDSTRCKWYIRHTSIKYCSYIGKKNFRCKFLYFYICVFSLSISLLHTLEWKDKKRKTILSLFFIKKRQRIDLVFTVLNFNIRNLLVLLYLCYGCMLKC